MIDPETKAWADAQAKLVEGEGKPKREDLITWEEFQRELSEKR